MESRKLDLSSSAIRTTADLYEQLSFGWELSMDNALAIAEKYAPLIIATHLLRKEWLMNSYECRNTLQRVYNEIRISISKYLEKQMIDEEVYIYDGSDGSITEEQLESIKNLINGEIDDNISDEEMIASGYKPIFLPNGSKIYFHE